MGRRKYTGTCESKNRRTAFLAARRQILLPENITNNYTIDRNEIERLRRDLEKTIKVLEIERHEKETVKKITTIF